jgi:transcriptional regulator with XRE-family HTH domain
MGARIQAAVKARGLTQRRVCELVDISENGLVNYTRDRRMPGADVLDRIARLCDVSAQWLIDGAPEPVTAGLYAQVNSSAGLLRECVTNLSVPPSFFEAAAAGLVVPSAQFTEKIEMLIAGYGASEQKVAEDGAGDGQEGDAHGRSIDEIKEILRHNPDLVKPILKLLRGFRDYRDGLAGLGRRGVSSGDLPLSGS